MIRFKPDPIREERNPFQVYLLCLAVFSGFSLISSDAEPTVGTIEYYLDGWAEAVWAWLLILGGLFSLAGMFWPWDDRDGLLIKRLGLLSLSIPVGIYALVIALKFGIPALTLALVVGGLAVASGIQAYRVGKKIKEIIDLTDEMHEEAGDSGT